MPIGIPKVAEISFMEEVAPVKKIPARADSFLRHLKRSKCGSSIDTAKAAWLHRLDRVFFRLKLYFGMSRVNADLSAKFPVQRGKKPTFDPFRLSDLPVLLSQDKEIFLP